MDLTKREKAEVNRWFLNFEDRLTRLEELADVVAVVEDLSQRVAAIEESLARRANEGTGRRENG